MTVTTTTTALRTALAGLYAGFVLGRLGFASWDQVHAMHSLADPRLILVFGGAVLLLLPLTALLAARADWRWPPRPYHPGSVPGGLLFGCGWALSGACPGTAFVALGAGQLGMLLVLLGIVLGNLAFALGQGRLFRFSTTGSCGDTG